LEKLKKKIKMR